MNGFSPLADARTHREAETAVVGLSHYAKAGFAYDSARTYEGREGREFFKPDGLWLSADGPDDWPSWCRGEDWGLDRVVERHVFEIAPGANVLRISDVAGIDALHSEFAVPDPWWQGRGRQCSSSLNWPEVARRWDGIIIAPYQWARRLDGDANWYYGWDCASGCIWNLTAIEYLGQQPMLPVLDDEADSGEAGLAGYEAEGGVTP